MSIQQCINCKGIGKKFSAGRAVLSVIAIFLLCFVVIPLLLAVTGLNDGWQLTVMLIILSLLGWGFSKKACEACKGKGVIGMETSSEESMTAVQNCEKE